MATVSKPNDETLEQLLAARREEVVGLQKAQAANLQDMESRGKTRLSALKRTLPKDMLAVLDTLDKTHAEAETMAKSQLADTMATYADSVVSPENQTAMHPGLAGGQLIAPQSLGWFTPYYGVLHGSDGSIYWQGANPGDINLSDYANGSGSGLFGTGAASFTVYMDWWFRYLAPQNRNYGHTIWVPFHGFYVVEADDGFWDSKQAHARIDLSAVGYQYNWKAAGGTNVIDIGDDNIKVNDRLDGWRTMYYADLLGADWAYLRVTASFYVYARGGGSKAQLNFADGNANKIGTVWVYVD